MNDARGVIPFYATFFTLAAILAVIASLERILGRPIPRLRDSRSVTKNRAFWAVPILMAAVSAWLWSKVVTMTACSHCSQTHRAARSVMLVVLGFGGAVGWIVYYLLLLGTVIARLILKSTRIL